MEKLSSDHESLKSLHAEYWKLLQKMDEKMGRTEELYQRLVSIENGIVRETSYSEV